MNHWIYIENHFKLFINNEFVDAQSGKTFPTINPATEEEIAQVQEAGEADVDAAVDAACQAFELDSEWRSMDASARAQIMNRVAQLFRRDAEKLANLEVLNSGKTYWDCLSDVESSAKCIEYYAGWCDKIHGKTIPVGKCGLINSTDNCLVFNLICKQRWLILV